MGNIILALMLFLIVINVQEKVYAMNALKIIILL